MSVPHPHLTPFWRQARDLMLVLVVLTNIVYGAILWGENQTDNRLAAQNTRFCKLVTGEDTATQAAIAQLTAGIVLNGKLRQGELQLDTPTALASASERQTAINKAKANRSKQQAFAREIRQVGCPAPPSRTTHR